MENVKEMMSVFGKLHKLNHGIALGGSVAAQLQHAGYREEAKDLDIIITGDDYLLSFPEGTSMILPTQLRYPADRLICTLLIDRVRVDVLKGFEGRITQEYHDPNLGPFNIVSIEYIVRAKLEIVMNRYVSREIREKHADDIVKITSKTVPRS